MYALLDHALVLEVSDIFPSSGLSVASLVVVAVSTPALTSSRYNLLISLFDLLVDIRMLAAQISPSLSGIKSSITLNV